MALYGDQLPRDPHQVPESSLKSHWSYQFSISVYATNDDFSVCSVWQKVFSDMLLN